MAFVFYRFLTDSSLYNNFLLYFGKKTITILCIMWLLVLLPLIVLETINKQNLGTPQIFDLNL